MPAFRLMASFWSMDFTSPRTFLRRSRPLQPASTTRAKSLDTISIRSPRLRLQSEQRTYTHSRLSFGLHNGTQASGINDAGQIVGRYEDVNLKTHGFLYSNGGYISLDDPLAPDITLAFGINDAGQIVGTYQSSPIMVIGSYSRSRAKPAAASRHHGRHDFAPRLRWPLRDLRHSATMRFWQPTSWASRDRLAVRRTRHFSRRRYTTEHDVAQFEYRRLRGLRHQQ